MNPARDSRSNQAMRRRRPATRHRLSSPPIGDHAYVEQGGRPTHVLVPIEEYERLIQAEMVKTAIPKLEEESGGWVDADAFALELAGERIAEARRAAGLTQQQLGAKLGVPQSQISRIEHHPDELTVRTLRRVAQALGVNLSALLP
jgi:HTH-type transcriptional regulator/antitoxin HipB